MLNSEMCNSFNAENKYAPCITDNADMRVILSVLYTMLEVIRCYEKEVAENRLPSSLALSTASSTSLSSIASQKDYTQKYIHMRNQLHNDLSKNTFLQLHLSINVIMFTNNSL